MKLLLVLSLGCLLHQAAAQCSRTVILMDVLPAGNVNPTVCPTTKCYYYTFADKYLTISTLGLTRNDILVFVPTSASFPENTATMTSNIVYLRNLAASTNLYVLTSNLEVGGFIANLNNNQMIKNLGSSITTLHVVDYNAYLTANPAPAVAAQNPCTFLATAPPTLAGACAFPVTPRVVILTDTLPPYANLGTNCRGSCSFYNTGMYLSLSTMGLCKNDAVIIIPTPSTLITTTNVIANKDYLTNLSLTTNVYVFTSSSPSASFIASNILINNIPTSFPKVIVKDYASYANPCPSNLPMGSCACNYFNTGFGG